MAYEGVSADSNSSKVCIVVLMRRMTRGELCGKIGAVHSYRHSIDVEIIVFCARVSDHRHKEAELRPHMQASVVSIGSLVLPLAFRI
jgi:hypothetical protein